MIKQRIAESPLLYFIHDTAPITLMTDASDYGIGGYLYQEVDGKKKLVALVSKSLSYQDTTEVVNNTKRSLRTLLLLYLPRRTTTGS